VNLDLDGRRALVGGGSRGLGLAICEGLSAEGARVALVARDRDRLDAAAALVDGVPVPVDLSMSDGPALAVERAAAELGGLDLVVVNTGGPPAGDFRALDAAAWRSALDATVMSAVGLIKAALPHLDDSPVPAVVIILSSSVRTPIPGLTISNLARPALAGLVKSLSIELAPSVRVNGVAPGRISTDRVHTLDQLRADREGNSLDAVQAASRATIPLGRYGDPRELANMVVFLLSPVSAYVTGQIVSVDGGMAKSLP